MIINISKDQQIMLHEDPIKCIEIKKSSNRVFPEIDHSANSARIAFEQSKFSKNVSYHLEFGIKWILFFSNWQYNTKQVCSSQ